MSDKIRIGISGGRFGERHAEAFATTEGVDLVGVADLDDEIRNRLIDTYGFKKGFESHSELVHSGDIDAIVITTPTNLHERHVSEAFDAGLHVLSEKPPATNAREMSQIVTTAGLVGKTYMWARQQRFSNELLNARKMIEEGNLGEVYHASAKWQWGWWPFEPDSWRGSVERGGGALLDIGIHIIDSLWFAIGCPDPVEAFASAHNLLMKNEMSDPDDAAEDSSFGMVRFKNGATLTYETSFLTHIEGPRTLRDSSNVHQLQVFGSKASIDMVSGEKIHVRPREDIDIESYAEAVEQEETFKRQAREFIDAIKEKREPQNTGKQGLTLMKMLDALALSAKEKRAVSIKAERSLEDLFGGV